MHERVCPSCGAAGRELHHATGYALEYCYCSRCFHVWAVEKEENPKYPRGDVRPPTKVSK